MKLEVEGHTWCESPCMVVNTWRESPVMTRTSSGRKEDEEDGFDKEYV